MEKPNQNQLGLHQQPAEANRLTPEQMFHEAERLLEVAGAGPPSAIKENLLAAIDLMLKSSALSTIELAKSQRQSNWITQEQYQQDVDQALDDYNRVQEIDTEPSNSPPTRNFIVLDDGTKMWI